MAIAEYNGVKVFSATMARDREQLGEKVTSWVRANPDRRVVHTVVTLSSDESFHCLTLTLFYAEK